MKVEKYLTEKISKKYYNDIKKKIHSYLEDEFYEYRNLFGPVQQKILNSIIDGMKEGEKNL